MKKALFKIAGLVGLFALCTSQAVAASASGNIGLNFSGYLRVPLSVAGVVTCSATAFLVPDTTNGSLTISALSASILANSALSSSIGVPATVQSNKQTFNCTVIVPFLYNQVVAGQNISVAWTVSVKDDGSIDGSTSPPSIIPGSGSRKTRQIIPNVSPTSQNLPLIQVYL